MELLLAVAVMSVAVASWIIATTFRIRIRENTTQLTQVTDQVAKTAAALQQAEKRLRTQGDHDQARWADEFETVRHQIGEAQVHLARHDEELRQHQDRLGDPGTESDQLGTASAEIGQLRQALSELGLRVRAAEEAARQAGDQAAEAAGGAAGRRQKDELQLASMARDISQLSRNLHDIRQYVQTKLDSEVALTRGNAAHRVLVGGIYTDQPAAADILPLLYDSLLQELSLETLFHDSAQPSSGRCYLLWRSLSDQSLEQHLETLLRSCASDPAAPVPGLTELRGLLLTLHNAGPGTLQVGPLVVVRTGAELTGAVLAAGDAGLLDGEATMPSPEEARKLLNSLDRDRLVELTPWADQHSG